ncbi:conserved protein of unknown function [Rhodovastum atsumiense]|nr:beta/gamma crystallin-related protein [Rhodovastum atsumiense]CAH2602564.1 conserved protein of unknown function [Rhodovastum atsumiense]
MTATTVILFEDINFGGHRITFTRSDPDLGNDKLADRPWPFRDEYWDNKASSMIVVGGNVTYYAEPNYQGALHTFGPGFYSNLGPWNDLVSSIRLS